LQIKGEEVVTPSATPAGQRAGALAGTSLIRRAQHWKGKSLAQIATTRKIWGTVSSGSRRLRTERKEGALVYGVSRPSRDVMRNGQAGGRVSAQKGTPFVQFWGAAPLYKRPVNANTRRMMRTIPPTPIPP
jgi:hypothetical protein